MENIVHILQSLGLLESEVKTYLAALENGAGTAIQLSKTTSLSRQAIYDAVGSLTERGIMSSATVGKKRFYAAEHPEALLAYAKRKELNMKAEVEKLERLVPKLALQMGGERPVVRTFEGKESIHAIMEDMTKTDFKVGYEMTDVEAMWNLLTEEDLKGYRTVLKQKGVEMRGIYSDRKSLGTPIVPGERYILPKEHGDFKCHIDVAGNKIKMVTFVGKIHAIIIEDVLLAQAMTTLLQLALKNAEKE